MFHHTSRAFTIAHPEQQNNRSLLRLQGYCSGSLEDLQSQGHDLLEVLFGECGTWAHAARTHIAPFPGRVPHAHMLHPLLGAFLRCVCTPSIDLSLKSNVCGQHHRCGRGPVV